MKDIKAGNIGRAGSTGGERMPLTLQSSHRTPWESPSDLKENKK